jgi:hypothetical protein
LTSVTDAWRAADTEARFVSGSIERLAHSVRGVLRTRAAPPHLPARVDGQLLVVDAVLVRRSSLDQLLGAISEAGLDPVALMLAGWDGPLERAGSDLPVLASARSAGQLADALSAYLSDEPAFLQRLSGDLRLKGAEAALAEPVAPAPAGLVAARIRRGVAVVADGELVALTPRPAGRALAARFAAIYARLLSGTAPHASALRRTVEGLWLLEQPVRAGAAVWVFDDLPLAAVDAAAAEALSVTLRALLRRPPPQPIADPQPVAVDHSMDATLLAVARANGRVTTAARTLGVHRNTVLYRLRRVSAERGIDPRRPDDALRLLREADDR